MHTKVNIEKRNVIQEVYFCDLSVGDFYLDEDGNLCQKIDEICNEENVANAIVTRYGSYREEEEDYRVIPVKNINITYDL